MARGDTTAPACSTQHRTCPLSYKPNKKLTLKLPVFSLSPEVITGTGLFGVSIISRGDRQKTSRIGPLNALTHDLHAVVQSSRKTTSARRAATGGPGPPRRANGASPASSGSPVQAPPNAPLTSTPWEACLGWEGSACLPSSITTYT